MSMHKVCRLDPADRSAVARWDDFVHTAPDATFFHRSGWQRLIREIFGHRTYYLYTRFGNTVTGVLPLAHVDSLMFGNALVSLPFAVYGGVAAVDAAAAGALEAEALAIAARLGVGHLEMRNVGARHPDWPRQDLYVTFRKEMLADAEQNLLAIPRKQRAMVRKGIKNGLAAEFERTADSFFALYADNVHRHGTPAMPRRYFDALLETFGSDSDVLTVRSPEGRPLSSVLTFYFRDEVLPYYAGDDEDARDLAANDFKYWELMRSTCGRGSRVFDYGRSKRDTGSFSFKKHWGFEPTPLHYEYRLFGRDSVPQNNPSNAKFRLFIEAWRRMPQSWANGIGPHIVRNLG